MAKKKLNYYDISNLLKTDAQYLMLLGQRSNGKSYQVKKTLIEAFATGIKNFVDQGTTFVYLRRWKDDIKKTSVEKYFDDIPISKLTNGEATKIIAYGNYLYLGTTDENGRDKKGRVCGYYCALNEAERYKSWVFKNTELIVYEEFITDRVYLNNEPTLLQQFVSTVIRNRNAHVFLVGNTLSRVCPYFNEWCLDKVLQQKINTIDIYHVHGVTEELSVNIAVEMCGVMESTQNMFFGNAAKQIVKGEWDVQEVPHLPLPLEHYESVYKVLVKYDGFTFVIELLVEPDEGGLLCFVYPRLKPNHKDASTRTITNEFSDKPWITAKLNPLSKIEMKINWCFMMGKVCYADNLTGADFKNVNAQFKIGNLV